MLPPRHKTHTNELVSGSSDVVGTVVQHLVSDLRASDLIPGVYEGGFKLWECAVDLSRFLAEMPEVRSGSTM